MDYSGVIDLGTNTFHLLIASLSKEGIKEIYRERIFVQLAENGIQTIGPAPFQRAVQAIQHYQHILEKYQVKKIKAFGTAALRTASNGQVFVEEILQKTGIQIELISGEVEADLIYKGVRQAVPFNAGNSMIMDIGGGSVEFIIANEERVHWAKSFPIGVAVLFNQFHENDPITKSEIEATEQFLIEQLQDLQHILQQFPSHRLIGASGTFDVLEKVLGIERISPIHSQVNVDEFFPFYKRVLFSTQKERLAMPNIPNTRAQLIIVALILIHTILKMANIRQVDISAYAMKEGILADMNPL